MMAEQKGKKRRLGLVFEVKKQQFRFSPRSKKEKTKGEGEDGYYPLDELFKSKTRLRNVWNECRISGSSLRRRLATTTTTTTTMVLVSPPPRRPS